MKVSNRQIAISELQAQSAEIVFALAEHREPVIITENGEAKAVLLDIASFERTQEIMALLKALALGPEQVNEGDGGPVAAAIERLRIRRKR